MGSVGECWVNIEFKRRKGRWSGQKRKDRKLFLSLSVYTTTSTSLSGTPCRFPSFGFTFVCFLI